MTQRAGYGVVVALALGLIAPLAFRLLSEPLQDVHGFFAYLPIGVYALFAWLAATSTPARPKLACFLMYAMIPFGVLLDVTIDLKFNGVDRNLFPFEVVIWAIVAPIPICVGYLFRLRRGWSAALAQ